MSRQRQRDRAAREAQAAAEQERHAAGRPGQDSRRRPPARPGRGPAPGRRAGAGGSSRRDRPTVYRQRRFPPLPWRLKLALALGWSVAVVLALVLVPTWTGRLGFVVVATFALPLIVVLVHDPTRRTR